MLPTSSTCKRMIRSYRLMSCESLFWALSALSVQLSGFTLSSLRMFGPILRVCDSVSSPASIYLPLRYVLLGILFNGGFFRKNKKIKYKITATAFIMPLQPLHLTFPPRQKMKLTYLCIFAALVAIVVADPWYDSSDAQTSPQ